MNLNGVERDLGVERDEALLTHHASGETGQTTICCRSFTPDARGSGRWGSLRTEELIEELLAVGQPFGKLGLQRVNQW